MRQKFLIFLALFLIVTCVWHLQPVSYNLDKIDKQLTNLKEPYKSVDVLYCFDGGSVAIEIIDRDKTKLDIFIDASMDSPHPAYSIITINGRKIKNVNETKKMLEDILIKYNDGKDLSCVRSIPRHFINWCYDELVGK